MLTLAGWASVSLIIIALFNVLLFGGLVYLVFMVRNQFHQLQQRTQPVLDEARSTMATVKEVAADVGQRAEAIAARAEGLATDVTQRAEIIAARVETLTSEVTQRAEAITTRAESLASEVSQRAEATVARVDCVATEFTRHAEKLAADATERADHVTANITQGFDRLQGDVIGSAERVIETFDRLINRVAERVDTTTAMVEEAVARPMIGIASVRAGVQKGLEAWRSYRHVGNGERAATEGREEAEARRMIEHAPPIVAAQAGDIDD